MERLVLACGGTAVNSIDDISGTGLSKGFRGTRIYWSFNLNFKYFILTFFIIFIEIYGFWILSIIFSYEFFIFNKIGLLK